MPRGDRPSIPMERDDVMALLRQPNPKCRTGCRDRALLTVLYTTGIRSDECRSIRMDHIVRTPQHLLRIMNPKGLQKGAARRSAGLNDGTWKVLEQWLAMRGNYDGWLFDTRTGGKIDAANYRKTIKFYAQRAGITRRVHQHALRHTRANEMLNSGTSVKMIQAVLGHTQLGTTDTYLRNTLGFSEAVDFICETEFSL